MVGSFCFFLWLSLTAASGIVIDATAHARTELFIIKAACATSEFGCPLVTFSDTCMSATASRQCQLQLYTA